jgi:cytochrome c oxidase subunit 4
LAPRRYHLDLPFPVVLLDHLILWFFKREEVIESGAKEFTVKNQNDQTYILVWLGLVILTAITVSMAGMNFGRLSILIVLLIAAIKSGLVLSYFMHLKYETGLLFKLMIPIVLAVLTVFIGLTFTDIAFR